MVIDTPPTLGFWTQAPLVASTDLLIPVDMGYFAVAGMRHWWMPLARLRQEVPLTLATPHILLTKCDAWTTLSAHVRAMLRESGGVEVLPHRDSRECRAGPRPDGTPEYFCVRSDLTGGSGLSARGGGVTRVPPRWGGQRHRAPGSAPEAGPRGPHSAQERARGSRRRTVAGGVSPRLLSPANGLRGLRPAHEEPQRWTSTYAETAVGARPWAAARYALR